MKHPRTALSCLAAAALLPLLSAHAEFPTLYLKPLVLKQIHSPTNITYAPDGSGRLFVCDQNGVIHVIQGGMRLPAPFLDISTQPAAVPPNPFGRIIGLSGQGQGYDERGLLGMAFHPGFNTPGSPGHRKFYLNYTKPYQAGIDPPPPVADHTPNCVTVIAEYTVSAGNPNVADPASERKVLLFTQPQFNHNGGQLEFGPDGFLYIGSGDGGGSQDNQLGHTGGTGNPRPTNNLGNAQDKTRLLGKLLRIDPVDPDGGGPLTYGIPADNPFFNDATPDVKREIYALGLRNPWRFSFDKRPGGTNRCFLGDAGQDRIEEVNLMVAGGNYGWRYLEGTENPAFSSGNATNPMPNPGGPFVAPILQYAHPNVAGDVGSPPLPKLGLSVTGGFVYRGAAIPALQGKYVFGDYGSTGGASDGRMMGLEETSPGSGVFTLNPAIPLVGTNPIVGQRILCLGEDEAGEIYVGLKTNAGVLQNGGDGLPAGGIYKIVSGNVVATLEPAQDNSIFAEVPGNANGAGDRLFAGNTLNGDPRRALLGFDFSAIPPGSPVGSASLVLQVEMGFATRPMSLHRLAAGWGQGATNSGTTGGQGAAANPGAVLKDATWTHRFFNTQAWTTPGGDFAGTASASTSVGTTGSFTWTSAQLAADVQGWVDDPGSNFGWVLIGDEVTTQTAKRFYSREHGTASQRPKLTVSYVGAAPLSHYDSWLNTYYPAGQFLSPSGDDDGDNVSNQVEYGYGLDPTTPNSIADTGFTTSSVPAGGGSTNLIITFRRDAEAADLTYQLQTSPNLLNWTTIATSVAGGGVTVQSGGFLVGESVIAGAFRLATVRQSLAASVSGRRFVRLQITRAP